MSRLQVYQVGRAGTDIAGGMSQVVNTYLAWRFHGVDTHLIATRDGSRGIGALARAARGLMAVARLPRDAVTVVAVHLSQGGSFLREGAAVALASARGLPVAVHLHGSSFPAYARAHPRRVRRILDRADIVLTLTDETAAAAAGVGVTTECRRIANPVATGTASTKERVVLFGGAVSRRKGVDTLLSAWNGIAADARDGWELHLAGPMTEPDVVAAVPAGVRLLGPLAHEELLRRLARAAIAVLPSRDEALPVFLIEAMAHRAAPIGTAVGAVPELLADGAGCIVAPGDAAMLGDALRRSMVDDDAREQTADRAQERFAARYSAEIVMPQLEAAWRDARNARNLRKVRNARGVRG